MPAWPFGHFRRNHAVRDFGSQLNPNPLRPCRPRCPSLVHWAPLPAPVAKLVGARKRVPLWWMFDPGPLAGGRLDLCTLLALDPLLLGPWSPESTLKPASFDHWTLAPCTLDSWNKEGLQDHKPLQAKIVKGGSLKGGRLLGPLDTRGETTPRR